MISTFRVRAVSQRSSPATYTLAVFAGLLVSVAISASANQHNDLQARRNTPAPHTLAPQAKSHNQQHKTVHVQTPEDIGKDGMPMVLIPAGEFTMGSSDGDADERPSHLVYLPRYYMDKFEITTAHYAHFIQATAHAHPYHWNEMHPSTDGNRPVVGVSWDNADAYCRWIGERLPTEAEWEKAARGTDGRHYPWGNQGPTPSLANYDWDGSRSWTGYAVLAPVGSYEAGKSPYGIYDLAGNVWEWVTDWYVDPYRPGLPSHSLARSSHGPYKARRRGAWANAPINLRASNRDWEIPTFQSSLTGFRCAQDVH